MTDHTAPDPDRIHCLFAIRIATTINARDSFNRIRHGEKEDQENNRYHRGRERRQVFTMICSPREKCEKQES